MVSGRQQEWRREISGVSQHCEMSIMKGEKGQDSLTYLYQVIVIINNGTQAGKLRAGRE